MAIQIIADSCCDVTSALKHLLNLSIASLKITVGEKEYRDDETLNTTALISEMKACKHPPSTACPTPEDYANLMTQAQESFVITLSSQLSGSYNAACVGKQLALEQDPSLKIHIFDSKSASAGETRLAFFLRHAIDAGYDFDTIIEQAEAFRSQMKTFFVLEDLSHLVKNGRISKTAGLLGTMLHIRPIMGENGNGEIIPIEKVRGSANAMRRLIALVASNIKQAHQMIIISYCNCLDRALELKKALLSQCPQVSDVILVPTNGISTVYADDGGIVVAF